MYRYIHEIFYSFMIDKELLIALILKSQCLIVPNSKSCYYASTRVLQIGAPCVEINLVTGSLDCSLDNVFTFIEK